MSEYTNEHERYEQQALGRDYLCMSPESVALRSLIDAIGSVVVVENSSAIDAVDVIVLNDE